MRGRLAVVALSTAFSLLSGCDGPFVVHPFDGTYVVMQWRGLSETRPGEHIELWVRDHYGSTIRVSHFNSNHDSYGFGIRPAVSPKDPCMIDARGRLLVDAGAYDHPVTIAGVTQSPEQQAEQVRRLIAQVTSTTVGGIQTSSLLAVVPYDDTPPPLIAGDVSPEER